MRSFPHKPDEAVLGESLAAGRQKFEELSDAPGKPSAYYSEASNLAFSLAGLTYAFEQPAAEVKSFAVHATRYALQAVACDDQMDPATYQRFLALSVWTSDANFRNRLATFDRAQFTHADAPSDDVVYRSAEAMAALARKRPDLAAEYAAGGLKRIERGLVATAVVNRVAPLLRIAEAMGKGDLYALRGAVSERNTQFLRTASAEAARNNPELLIDVVGLALVRIGADDYGLSVEPKSLYMPTTGLF